MSIMYRCQCKTFYSLENKTCPKCNGKSRAYYLVYRENGKQKRIKAGETITEARATEISLLVEPQKFKDTGKILLSEFVAKVFKPYYLAKNMDRQAKSNTNLLNRVLSYLPDKYLVDYQPRDIELYLNLRYNHGLAIATRNNELALIKHIFNYALELDYIYKSPVKAKKQPANNERSRYLTLDEQAQLLQACKQSESIYLYDLVYIALHTGMRRGEIQQLHKSWITQDGILIPNQKTKSKKGRFIPFTNELKIFINDYLSNNENFDFNHDIKKSFDTAVKRANITDFTFHDLRHTFASRLVQAGASLYIVSKLLGHSTTEITKRYGHLNPQALKNVIDLL